MRYVKWTLIALILLLLGGFFHYTLPQRDIVRVVNTYNERTTIKGWTSMFWGGAENATADGVEVRDVQFISTVKANGKPMVYRNEDTGWGWPPYFKFDTATLYTEIADAASTSDAPKWVAITHYGWRNELLSIYPNAVGIKEVAGPNDTRFPWLNAVILVGLALFVLTLYRIAQQFRRRTIDPLVEDAEEFLELADDKKDSTVDRVKGWFKRR